MSASGVLRLVLVDQQVLFRQGLAHLIDSQPDLSVVGEASSIEEAAELIRSTVPDVVLLDLILPDGSGLDLARCMLKERPDLKIVFLTAGLDDESLFAAIREGAKGYLPKYITSAELLGHVRAVARGEAAITSAVASRILDKFPRSYHATGPFLQSDSFYGNTLTAELTPRELEVLRELGAGSSNREIAARLVISENTVKHHISSILEKLQLRNRREASRYVRML